MMKILTRGFLLMLLWPTAAMAADNEEGLGAGMVNPGYEEKPEWFKQSFLDIREDISEATAGKRRLLLYFYQDGCPYCAKLLRDNLGQRKIAQTTRQYFNVIAINMWGDREVTALDGSSMTEKQFAASLKVMYTPTMLFLDEQGKKVLRVNGYYAPDKFSAALEYAGRRMESRLSFRDYYKQLKPEKASGKLHQADFHLKPPYDLQKLLKDSKPLLVLFEQKQCFACDELYQDIFRRKQTREQLSRLNVVRLDMWSNIPLRTPEGKSTTAQQWAKQLNVQYAPSMLYFAASGKEVFRSEAYLKSFHIQSVMDYVASQAYKTQPNFQRFISARADKLEAQGIHVDLMD